MNEVGQELNKPPYFAKTRLKGFVPARFGCGLFLYTDGGDSLGAIKERCEFTIHGVNYTWLVTLGNGDSYITLNNGMSITQTLENLCVLFKTGVISNYPMDMTTLLNIDMFVYKPYGGEGLLHGFTPVAVVAIDHDNDYPNSVFVKLRGDSADSGYRRLEIIRHDDTEKDIANRLISNH